jgi:hypothetical protein
VISLPAEALLCALYHCSAAGLREMQPLAAGMVEAARPLRKRLASPGCSVRRLLCVVAQK